MHEANILALGAIADGCKAELTPHLPVLHQFLLRQLTVAESMLQLRGIAAWTLARYASWTIDQLEMRDSGGGGGPVFGEAGRQGVCVAHARPSQEGPDHVVFGHGVFAKVAGDHLTPYLEPIYGIFIQALHKYCTRSRLVLFDTMGIMAENVGEGVGRGLLPGMYIPPLLQLWNSTAINNPFDRTLLILMECLGSSMVVCRLNYQPLVLETFEMAMSTIEACTIIILHEDNLGDIDKEMTDPIICLVDLIDGLVEGLGPNFASLVNGSSRFGLTFPNILQDIATLTAIPSQCPG